MEDKIKKLEADLKKYQKQLIHMSTEYAATREGSAYGCEYYEIQCRVLESMVNEIKTELVKLKSKNK